MDGKRLEDGGEAVGCCEEYVGKFVGGVREGGRGGGGNC